MGSIPIASTILRQGFVWLCRKVWLTICPSKAFWRRGFILYLRVKRIFIHSLLVACTKVGHKFYSIQEAPDEFLVL